MWRRQLLQEPLMSPSSSTQPFPFDLLVCGRLMRHSLDLRISATSRCFPLLSTTNLRAMYNGFLSYFNEMMSLIAFHERYGCAYGDICPLRTYSTATYGYSDARLNKSRTCSTSSYLHPPSQPSFCHTSFTGTSSQHHEGLDQG